MTEIYADNRDVALYVSPWGSDEYPGSKGQPLATIHAARDRIRSLKAGEGLPEGGVTVFLRGGEYVFDRLDGPGVGYGAGFTLTREQDSGTENAPVLYRAYPGESVTLALSPRLDFQASPIMNRAEHVYFEGIEVRGGIWSALHRPPVREIRPATGEPLRLVGDGRALATVVIADEPSETARYAAEELVYHVRRASGVGLPVVAESEAPPNAPGRPRVFMGETRAAERAGLHVAELAPEVYILKTVDGDLYILGRESEGSPMPHSQNQNRLWAYNNDSNPWVGTMHGLYDVIERSLDVRWLWPGELGTYIPERREVLIAPVDEAREPALRYRSWSNAPNIPNDGPQMVYMLRHGAGRGARPFITHRFGGWWRNTFADRHPEWFALNEQGERTGHAMCVSNPELRREAVRFWGGSNQSSLGEADTTEWCRCTECMALDAPHPEDLDLTHVWMNRVLADRYADFWREVLERARRVNPGIRVSTFLYWQTFHAPLGEVELGPGVHGEFVPWMGKTMWFPMPEDAFAHIKAQWQGWQRTGISMAYRPNYFHGGYVLPFLSTRQAGNFLRFTFEQGSLGWHSSFFGHWTTQGPMLYMHMRMLRDPETTVDQTRVEYFSGFGPAADAIERYFDYWEEFSHQVVNAHLWPRWGLQEMISSPRIYTPAVFTPAAAILDEALDAARRHPDGQYARRVEFIRLGLDHAAATMRFIALLDNGEVVLHDRERFEATQKAWRELQGMRNVHRDTGFIDLEQIENRLEGRWLKGLSNLDKDFETVREAPPQPTPWAAWQFRADPENRGVEEGWFAGESDEVTWREIPVPAHWSATWNTGYLGYGWYRTAFRFPREWSGEPLRLSFGGVDEQAWVYVNGVFAGEHSVESENMGVGQLWNRPFEIEIPAAVIRPGEVNTLVVRVHASQGDGGIHGQVGGAAPHPEDRQRLPAWEEQ